MNDKKNIFLYIPIVAVILGSLYSGITVFNSAMTTIEKTSNDVELLRKDLGYFEAEMTRTKDEFTKELTRTTTLSAKSTAYIEASRETSYKLEDTVRQNTYDIKELTRQLNGGW